MESFQLHTVAATTRPVIPHKYRGVAGVLFGVVIFGLAVTAGSLFYVNYLAQQEPLDYSGPVADAHLKTYTNSAYGFSFQYPDNLTVMPNNSLGILSINFPKNSGLIDMQVYSGKATPPSIYRPNGAVPTTPITLGGKTTQQYHTDSPSGENVALKLPYTNLVTQIDGSHFIEIQYYSSSSSAPIIDQILSTFTFTK